MTNRFKSDVLMNNVSVKGRLLVGDNTVLPGADYQWPKISVTGSSITAHNSEVTSSRVSNSTRGWLNWALFLSDQRLQYGVWKDDDNDLDWFGANQAISGQNSREIEARFNSFFNTKPNIAVLQNGTNEASLNEYENIIRTKEDWALRCLDHGIIPVLFEMMARDSSVSGWESGSDKRKVRLRVNNWIREFAARTPGVIAFNTNKYLIDPSSADGDLKPGYSYDGTHLGPLAGYYVGKAFKEDIIDPLFPVYPLLITSAEDLYDAENLPSGNHYNNLLNRGTGGTAGTAVTGDVADGITYERQTGSHVSGVASLSLTDDGGAYWQNLALTSTGGDGSNDELFRTITSPANLSLPEGWYRGACKIKVSEGPHKLTGFNMLIDNLSNHQADSMVPYSEEVLAQEAMEGTLLTPYLYTDGSANMRQRIEVTALDNTEDVTVSFTQTQYLSVANPEETWGKGSLQD